MDNFFSKDYADTLYVGASYVDDEIAASLLTLNASNLTSGTVPDARLSTNVTLLGNTTTGTGSIVRATSPTLVTPLLGTPTSGTLTNCTGLPISTGVSGLATGVATFLATPTSANLAAAVTNETGSGSLVFATSPTLTTPNIGAATGTTFTTGSVVYSGSGISYSGQFVVYFGQGTGIIMFRNWLETGGCTFNLNTDNTLVLRNKANNGAGDLVLGNLTLAPSASRTPASNGDLVVEATSNTSVTIKLKGSDGTVRSVVLTLA